jgi:hypothetical protein
MKQHNRYSDTGKNATIIRVVNGLALSMVTVFEDIFLKYFIYRFSNPNSDFDQDIACRTPVPVMEGMRG